MRHILSLSIVLAIAPPGIAAAEGMDTFDGTERLVVGQTRLQINNFATYQCGWRLVFDTDKTVRKKDGNIALSVRTIAAAKGECGCKARTNDFHLYRARRLRIDQAGMTVPDELVAKGRIGPSGHKTFVITPIYRKERKSDYYINHDCTD